MGGFLLSLARRSPKQARSINHVKKRIKKEEKWSVFCFNSCSVPGHPEDSNLSGDSLKWRIWEFRRNIPCYIYSRVIIIFMWRLWQSKAGCLNLWAPSSPLTSDCIKEGYVSQFYRLLLIFLQVRRSFVSFFVTFLQMALRVSLHSQEPNASIKPGTSFVLLTAMGKLYQTN